MFKSLVFKGVAVLLLGLSLQALAMKIVPVNLEQMTKESKDIVAGVVHSVTDGFDEKGIPYTEVSIRVGKSAKGGKKEGELYTFRQFGLLAPKKLPSGNYYYGVSPEHFPTWNKDENVVVFMFRPASQTGLQAPVGLAQGKFNVIDGKVSNGLTSNELFDNAQLPPNMTTEERDMVTHPNKMLAKDFFSLVEKFVANEGAVQ